MLCRDGQYFTVERLNLTAFCDLLGGYFAVYEVILDNALEYRLVFRLEQIFHRPYRKTGERFIRRRKDRIRPIVSKGCEQIGRIQRSGEYAETQSPRP